MVFGPLSIILIALWPYFTKMRNLKSKQFRFVLLYLSICYNFWIAQHENMCEVWTKESSILFLVFDVVRLEKSLAPRAIYSGLAKIRIDIFSLRQHSLLFTKNSGTVPELSFDHFLFLNYYMLCLTYHQMQSLDSLDKPLMNHCI